MTTHSLSLCCYWTHAQYKSSIVQFNHLLVKFFQWIFIFKLSNFLWFWFMIMILTISWRYRERVRLVLPNQLNGLACILFNTPGNWWCWIKCHEFSIFKLIAYHRNFFSFVFAYVDPFPIIPKAKSKVITNSNWKKMLSKIHWTVKFLPIKAEYYFKPNPNLKFLIGILHVNRVSIKRNFNCSKIFFDCHFYWGFLLCVVCGGNQDIEDSV